MAGYADCSSGSVERKLKIGVLPIRKLFSAPLLFVLVACGGLGPGRVEVDAANYSSAISKAERTSLLSNIVGLRYGEAPAFLELTQVVTSYSIEAEGTVEVEGSVDGGGAFPDFAGLGAGAVYGNRPTITYKPLSGKQYLGSILIPVDEARALAGIAAGWPPDLVIGLLIQNMNGVMNSQTLGLTRRPATPEFAEVTRLISSLVMTGALEIRVDAVSSGDTGLPQGTRTVLFIENPGLFGENSLTELRRLSQLLRLPQSVREFEIRKGQDAPGGNQLAIQTRSVLGVMNSLAASIDVPQADVARGLTFATVQGDLPGLPVARVRSGPIAPRDAFAATRRNGTWFWVDDADFASKRVLSFVALILSLTSDVETQGDPILTISASR